MSNNVTRELYINYIIAYKWIVTKPFNAISTQLSGDCENICSREHYMMWAQSVGVGIKRHDVTHTRNKDTTE